MDGMNIHPIIVHFPIAMLSLYAGMECLRARRLLALSGWLYAKSALLWIGFAGALASAATGDFARSLYRSERDVIRAHENFAGITIVIFGILALIYIVVVADRLWGERMASAPYAPLWKRISKIGGWLVSGPVALLAVAGFMALAVTGALGGIIVYGPDADIFTRIVARIILGQ
jgi:hypothetical protein